MCPPNRMRAGRKRRGNLLGEVLDRQLRTVEARRRKLQDVANTNAREINLVGAGYETPLILNRSLVVSYIVNF